MSANPLFSDRYQNPGKFSYLSENPELKKRGIRMRFQRIRNNTDLIQIRHIYAKMSAGVADDYVSMTAFLLVMAVWWDFRVPTDFQAPILDEQGEPTFDDEGCFITERHPLAGKMAPLTEEWFGKLNLPPEVVRDMYFEVMGQWEPARLEGETEEQFRGESTPVPATPEPRPVRRSRKALHAVPDPDSGLETGESV